MRYVVDASVAAESLLRTPLGDAMASVRKAAVALALELLVPETLTVLRRGLLDAFQEMDLRGDVWL